MSDYSVTVGADIAAYEAGMAQATSTAKTFGTTVAAAGAQADAGLAKVSSAARPAAENIAYMSQRFKQANADLAAFAAKTGQSHQLISRQAIAFRTTGMEAEKAGKRMRGAFSGAGSGVSTFASGLVQAGNATDATTAALSGLGGGMVALGVGAAAGIAIYGIKELISQSHELSRAMDAAAASFGTLRDAELASKSAAFAHIVSQRELVASAKAERVAHQNVKHAITDRNAAETRLNRAVGDGAALAAKAGVGGKALAESDKRITALKKDLREKSQKVTDAYRGETSAKERHTAASIRNEAAGRDEVKTKGATAAAADKTKKAIDSARAAAEKHNSVTTRSVHDGGIFNKTIRDSAKEAGDFANKADASAKKLAAIDPASAKAFGAIAKFTRETKKVPAKKTTDLIVNWARAGASIDSIISKLNTLHDRTINIQINQDTRFSKHKAASGAFIAGPYGVDNTPVMVSGGEAILNPRQIDIVGRANVMHALSSTGAQTIQAGGSYFGGGAPAGIPIFNPPSQSRTVDKQSKNKTKIVWESQGDYVNRVADAFGKRYEGHQHGAEQQITRLEDDLSIYQQGANRDGKVTKKESRGIRTRQQRIKRMLLRLADYDASVAGYARIPRFSKQGSYTLPGVARDWADRAFDKREAAKKYGADILDTTHEIQSRADFDLAKLLERAGIPGDVANARLTETLDDDIAAQVRKRGILEQLRGSGKYKGADFTDITNELADTLDTIKGLQDQKTQTAADGTSASSDGTTAGDNADLNAQLAQANERARVQTRRGDLSEAAVRAFGSPGDIGSGGYASAYSAAYGGPRIAMLGDPASLAAFGLGAVGGMAMQPGLVRSIQPVIV